MRDFTLSAYELLLRALRKQAYTFVTFEEYLDKGISGKQVILRHDVDKLPLNSLDTARLENQMGIRASYYFRIVRESNHPEVIRAIADLGHEIGYHYEDLALARGDHEEALAGFKNNLAYFRQYYPVTTICMHGSPMSKWDNRNLWQNFTYKVFGIKGEPYFDIDFNRFCYLTDTGRRWNGDKVSVRDKVAGIHKLDFQSTFDIIRGIRTLPDQVMITTHPQRWENKWLPWATELILQNLKNKVKGVIASSTH